jgi:hypothetical protein
MVTGSTLYGSTVSAPESIHSKDSQDALLCDLLNTLHLDHQDAARIVRSAAGSGGQLLADAVKEIVHGEFLHTSWPPCPAHPNHPLVVRDEDDGRTWRCPSTGEVFGRVGELPDEVGRSAH